MSEAPLSGVPANGGHVADEPGDGAARILDRGYRRFDGERSGVRGAVRSVAWHTTRSILGLGRPARHKIFPVIVVLVSFMPALVFLGIAALFGDLLDDTIRPDYWEFFGFAFIATLLFTSMIAPEAIVRDRRDKMFSLYLSTPLTKPSYLAAKAIAVLSTMALVVVAPPVLWLLGYTFQSQGPDGVGGWFGVMGRIVLAGIAICIVYSAVGLGAASLTDRRAFASIAVVFVLLGASIAVNVLVESADVSQAIRLLDPLGLGFEIPPRVFGDRTFEYDDVPTWQVAAACIGWTSAGVGTIIARYRKLAAV
ncbi:MAG: ABC transporter permease [Ilumatobacter sp.]